MSIYRLGISSGFEVGVGAARDGVVGAEVDEGVGGSFLEQPETIEAVSIKMTTITCLVDIVFNWRSLI
jgi:hypothetical protein